MNKSNATYSDSFLRRPRHVLPRLLRATNEKQSRPLLLDSLRDFERLKSLVKKLIRASDSPSSAGGSSCVCKTRAPEYGTPPTRMLIRRVLDDRRIRYDEVAGR